jgi:hypothetical protein
MKNIHIIPTKFKSLICKIFEDIESSKNIFNLTISSSSNENDREYQNICITNDEEIKEGDCYYILSTKEVLRHNFSVKIEDDGDHKKIILTTDEDLIKNGVQEISEDFLQWFVKNPSCEFVEVEKIRVISYSFPRNAYAKYRITIPKEEPKQSVEKYEQQGLEKYFEEPNYNMKQEILDEMNKQETLEDKKFQQKLVDKLNNGELSYQNAPIYTILLDLVQGNSVDEVYRVFCEVIKEQDKNKYSEEEVIELLKTFDIEFNAGIVERNKGIKEWFEKFKKK